MTSLAMRESMPLQGGAQDSAELRPSAIFSAMFSVIYLAADGNGEEERIEGRIFAMTSNWILRKQLRVLRSRFEFPLWWPVTPAEEVEQRKVPVRKPAPPVTAWGTYACSRVSFLFSKPARAAGGRVNGLRIRVEYVTERAGFRRIKRFR